MNDKEKIKVLRKALQDFLDSQDEADLLEHDTGNCNGIGNCVLCDARMAMADTMPMKRPKIYVGNRANQKGEIFKSVETPLESTHGDKYSYVLGPFRTMRGARFYVNYGSGNPHCTHVSHIEKLAKADEMHKSF